jgi:uncharacterized flavoprotein (TIGR03862 family)
MKKIAIIGTGPAALMAASILCEAKLEVHLFERRKSAGWKLLVAGSSGLNVTHGGEEAELFRCYRTRAEEMKKCLAIFPRARWLKFLEELGETPYLGTSKRYLIENEKAAALLKRWVETIQAKGGVFHFAKELQSVNFSEKSAQFQDGTNFSADSFLFALGGPSWEKSPSPWPQIFSDFTFTPFQPANAGYSFAASPDFFQRAEGKPIKGLALTTRLGTKVGELMITRYGLEGTPIYTLGCPGEAELDLKPDLSLERLIERLGKDPKFFWRQAKLSPGAEILAKEFLPAHGSPEEFARKLKNYKIQLLAPQPLTESISASGGLSWNELDENLMLKKAPDFYCAGEMVDWDAPTGGFLLQGSVSMGAVAAFAIAKKFALATV